MAGPNGAPTIHSGLLAGFGAFASNADVQVFVPTVCAQTQPPGTAGLANRGGAWVKPIGTRFVLVLIQGAGGGGGSGRKGSTTTVCCGGGGGSSGNFTFALLLASDLPDELPLVVLPGGTGAAGISAADTSGSTSPNQQSTILGWNNPSGSSNIQSAIAFGSGGAGGIGGTAASGVGGGVSNFGTWNGSSGGAASTTGAAGAGGANNLTGLAPSGGGAGGGLTSSNVHSAGGGSGASPMGAQIVGGAVAGGTGSSGLNPLMTFQQNLLLTTSVTNGFPLPAASMLLPVGCGGGGGGSANSTDAVSGGNGGNGCWGGGGGGGGAATDTSSPQSGAGGNGGDGYIIVVSW